MKDRQVMITRRIEMERFSLISSKPFQAVLAALKAAVGHPGYGGVCQGGQRCTDLS
jgi:hypothetical protein